MIRRPTKGPLTDPLQCLDSIEGNTFELKPRAHDKSSVILLLIDQKTRYRWAFLLINKAGPTIFSAVKSFFKRLKNQYNRYPKRLFFDGGKEINSDLENWLTAKGIDFITFNPYVHKQNGLIERSMRVLIERLKVTIIGAQLPYYPWCYILPTVLKLIDNTAITTITPYQALMDNLNPGQNNVPNLSHYRIIGAPCKVLIPSKKRQKAHKLAPKTKPGRLLAVLSLKTFLIWVPAKRIMVKTPFIQLKEKALLRDKTAIPKNLSTGERELINLVTNNDGDNDLGKDATPKESINSLIISNSNPETSEINYYGANLEAKFWELNFVKQIINLIPKAFNE